MKDIILAGLVSGLVVFQAGCLVVGAVGAGAGTAMYVRGDLETTSSKPVAEVYSVVEQACKDLEFEIYKHEQKPFSGLIVANSDFGKVAFTMKGKSPTETELSIRVGTFGDKGASELIFAKLKPKL
jgi:hypothetical protein|tara:strand:+ start:158 stop:535 length:378 start_codon:yes stop_codon:yes gene_type:complete